jgi:hypothetical protein
VKMTVSVGISFHPDNARTPRSCSAPPTTRCTWPRGKARTAGRSV